MTTIKAKIIADSISEQGIRLTTVQMRYPRIIHSELNTHRMFSRSARSTRAVPTKVYLGELDSDPFVPLHWGKNQKGMQAAEETDAPVTFGGSTMSREQAWLTARDRVVEVAKGMMDAGYHKAVVSRLLEPWSHIDVLVTSTSWNNFFALRDHPDAEPHIAMLAREVRKAMDGSAPTLLAPGLWHMPFIMESDIELAKTVLLERDIAVGYIDRPSGAIQDILIKMSVARCARISYAPFDGNASAKAELTRYDLLAKSNPPHASPMEHCATPDTQVSFRFRHERLAGGNVISYRDDIKWENANLHGNFVGWKQYRKMLPDEYVPG